MPSYVYTKREIWQCVSSQLLTEVEKQTNEKKKKKDSVLDDSAVTQN